MTCCDKPKTILDKIRYKIALRRAKRIFGDGTDDGSE